MAELAPVRRARLARLVAARGFVRVSDVAEELEVSEVTLRGDLSALEQQGLVVRVHGGAMPTSAIVAEESSIESSLGRDEAAKRGIGAAAAQLVSSGESVFVDAGSTALALAVALVERRELHDVTLVTSGLSTALVLEAGMPRFTVIVTGGTLRPLQHSLVNPFAAPMLEQLHLDWAFIGCNGVDETGVTNVNIPEAEIKTIVMRRARRKVVLADTSKLGRRELAVIAGPGDYDTLVTDAAAPASLLDPLRSAGIGVLTSDNPARPGSMVP
jgi:DeoR/GlpR family transcriptional regulator of sugar metabolism